MKRRRTILVGALALAVGGAVPMIGRAHDKDKDDKARPVQDATVHFGQRQPQTPDPAPVAAAVTHFLMPNDVTIHKGGTVTFVVNGGGHGIAIHPVSKTTTREDIAEDLCAGATPENPDPIVDRRTRAAVCNGTVPTTVTVNGTPVLVTGTQNLDYSITDGKDNLIVHTGFNLTAANSVPPTIITNPRVDDTTNTHQILATSGRSAGDTANPAAIANNPAGAFLTGSAAPATPGNRIRVQFLKTGRYLVICMNRGHSLNDHMFGFVNVADDGEDDQ